MEELIAERPFEGLKIAAKSMCGLLPHANCMKKNSSEIGQQNQSDWILNFLSRAIYVHIMNLLSIR